MRGCGRLCVFDVGLAPWATALQQTGQSASEDSFRLRGMSLRWRLLLGLGVAVVLPLILFGVFGVRELGRSSSENLIEELLGARAKQTAKALEGIFDRSRDQAVLVHASLFESGQVLPKDFDDWALRVSGSSSGLGRFLILDPQGKELFRGGPEGRLKQGQTGPGLPEVWVQALLTGTGSRFFPPLLDPLAELKPLTETRDPASYVLPLGLPLRDDDQVAKGALFFLLPLRRFEQEIERSWRELEASSGLLAREVFVLDRGSGRYVLHSDRARIGEPALGLGESASEVSDQGEVMRLAELARPPGLSWVAGVAGLRKEFFFASVDQLQRYLWFLVLLVLATTLGMGAWLSFASTRSLRKLEDVTEQLGQGRLEARAIVEGPREVRKLAQALNDMASRVEAEREREKLVERDRAWTAMARQVAHEIKNPLQPMRLHGELLERTGSEQGQDRVRNSAQVILRQVDALSKIVQGFSSFAEAAGSPRDERPYQLSEVLDQVGELYDLRTQPAVRIVDESGGPTLVGSALRLQQVLVNLINNALEASAHDAEEILVRSSLDPGGPWLQIEVMDRGEGLPSDLLDRGFEPYDSSKPGGSGLGLAICVRNLEAMGGKLELLGREGGGTTARVLLPLGTGEQRT